MPVLESARPELEVPAAGLAASLPAGEAATHERPRDQARNAFFVAAVVITEVCWLAGLCYLVWRLA